MKKALRNIGIFLLLVLSSSLILVSAVNLYSMNRAERELYEMKLRSKAAERKSTLGTKAVKVDIREAAEENFVLQVPQLLQRPKLPQGCEITALTSVLNYYGYEITAAEMAEKYLPKRQFFKKNGRNYGVHPKIAYAGDPAKESGWFCYAEPIVEAANLFFKQEQILDRAENFSGKRRDQIIDELSRGNPIIVWVTVDFQTPRMIDGWYDMDTDQPISVPINSHCVVLNGFYGKQLLIMDPLQGEVRIDADRFFESYYNLGAYAVKLDRN